MGAVIPFHLEKYLYFASLARRIPATMFPSLRSFGPLLRGLQRLPFLNHSKNLFSSRQNIRSLSFTSKLRTLPTQDMFAYCAAVRPTTSSFTRSFCASSEKESTSSTSSAEKVSEDSAASESSKENVSRLHKRDKRAEFENLLQEQLKKQREFERLLAKHFMNIPDLENRDELVTTATFQSDRWRLVRNLWIARILMLFLFVFAWYSSDLCTVLVS